MARLGLEVVSFWWHEIGCGEFHELSVWGYTTEKQW